MHQDDSPFTQMPNNTTETLTQVIAVRLDALHNDVAGMRDVLRELATAVTKLAIIEERQGQAAQALERAFKVLEKVENRLDALEKSQPGQQKTSDWVDKAIWGAVAAVAFFVGKKMGMV